MMLKIKIMRPAIAMLELIFALVIMGIILMSAPQLINTATKSSYVAIQQEAINEAASQVNMIMGYNWDENNVDERFIPPILRVTSGDVALEEDGTTGRRPGTPEVSYRSFIRSDGEANLTASTAVDINETVEDDMDDFSDTNTSLIFIAETTLESNVADYIESNTTQIARDVTYSTDNANYNQSSFTYIPFIASGGTTTTNIKSITVTVKSSSGLEELDKEIILRGFSCNIGGYKLEEREF